MGQKTHPIGYRTGIYLDWSSRWYAPKKDFARLLKEDRKIRTYVKQEFKGAGIPKIEIERKADALRIIVHTAKPGILIGRKGVKAEELKTKLESELARKVGLDIVEIAKPELDATLVAEGVAEQLEKRASFRRTMKRAIQQTMERGAKGIKLVVAGRLGGAEIARTEKQIRGSIPLSTLKANIDYGVATAKTTYGTIGVKCWVYTGTIPAAEPARQEAVSTMATMPKRVKFRKSQRGVIRGVAQRGNEVSFGEWGLQCLTPGWIKANVIEACRVAAVRGAPEARLYIRIFPHKSVTSTPEETRMGTGKGEPDYWCAVVKPGTVMFELGGVLEETARKTFNKVSHKLPVRTRLVRRRHGV